MAAVQHACASGQRPVPTGLPDGLTAVHHVPWAFNDQVLSNAAQARAPGSAYADEPAGSAAWSCTNFEQLQLWMPLVVQGLAPCKVDQVG